MLFAMRHDGTAMLPSTASRDAAPFGRYPDLPSFIYGVTREIWEDRGVGAKLKHFYAEDVIVRAVETPVRLHRAST